MIKNTKSKNAIIFLDIDYVLNDAETTEMFGKFSGIDDDKVALLKKITDIFDADIVLTSTWRKYWVPDLDPVKKERGRYGRGRYLNRKLAVHGLSILDKTPDLNWYLRGREVQEWLISHPNVKQFVILDDEDFRWEKFGLEKHWVNTYDINAIGYDGGLKPKHVEYVRNNTFLFQRKS